MSYDDPGLRPVEFLRQVMHDPKADIRDRVKAATALLDIEPHGPPKPVLTFRLEVPLEVTNSIQLACASFQQFADEQTAYFLSLPLAEQKELIDAVDRLERCNEVGVGSLDHMPVKGRA
jgi:hypothetical protein